MPRPIVNINNRHLAYILFKVGGYGNQEIADILGLSHGTIVNWGKDKAIRELRQAVEVDMKSAARDYIESLLPEIVYTLADIMRNGSSERVRLDAASRLLDKALPMESVTKLVGDPNAPIFHELLKSREEQDVFQSIGELTPEQKTEYAAAIQKLEDLANATAVALDDDGKYTDGV